MPRAPPPGIRSQLVALLLMAAAAAAGLSVAVATRTPPSPLEDGGSSSSSLLLLGAAGGDLSPSAAACPPPGPLCPPPCPANSTVKSTQCLYYLQETHKEEVCGPETGPERRREALHGLRMRHCCEHAADRALPEDAFHGDAQTCRRHIHELLAIDQLASRISCQHGDVLSRYDCGQTYSIAHRCSQCKEAYRRWVCSNLVPHFTRFGKRVRPCLSVCQDVEQQCPYLLPGDWTNQTVPPGETAHPTPQYAGEPTFLCLDPNIPETGEQRRKSSRGDEDCCYRHCGSPGRGPSATTALDEVCEHCPGRPPNIGINDSSGVATAVTAAAAATTTTTSASTRSSIEDAAATTAAASSSAAPSVHRYYHRHRGAAPSAVDGRPDSSGRTCFTITISKVSLLWTAWIITLIEHTQTIYNTLKCLLVLCATSVRTTPLTTWTETKKCGPCS